jgi:hypothetical protein
MTPVTRIPGIANTSCLAYRQYFHVVVLCKLCRLLHCEHLSIYEVLKQAPEITKISTGVVVSFVLDINANCGREDGCKTFKKITMLIHKSSRSERSLPVGSSHSIRIAAWAKCWVYPSVRVVNRMLLAN